jgi:hypothetical protein
VLAVLGNYLDARSVHVKDNLGVVASRICSKCFLYLFGRVSLEIDPIILGEHILELISRLMVDIYADTLGHRLRTPQLFFENAPYRGIDELRH